VTIKGNVNVTDRDYHNRYDSKIIVNTEQLTLTGNSKIESSFFFVHSHGDIKLEKGFNVTSIIR